MTTVTLPVDCDADPTLPSWAQSVTNHVKGGNVDPHTLVFFQTDKQKRGSYTNGMDLSGKTRSAKLQPCNANMAIFLSEHEEFLKRVEKHIAILLFLDTEFLGADGGRYFRCMLRNDVGRWYLNNCFIGRNFYRRCAVVASASMSSVT